MKVLRRILGILVMCAGVLGLLLSLAGLVTIWVAKPTISSSITNTITMLNSAVSTTHQAMQIAGEALGGTVQSVEALSTMLSSTATSIQDTQPMLEQIKVFMGEKMPDTIEKAASSLRSAQKGAEVVDSAIKSLDTFRTVLSAAPLIGGFVEAPKDPYNPDESLADSLGRLATGLEPLPQTFIDMSSNLDKADDNLTTVQTSLTTMSSSVTSISSSLNQYQDLVSQSQTTMANLTAMLTNLQTNLNNILNAAAVVMSLFFVWLLAAQVVIFSQGWELYRGTAGRMESGSPEPVAAAAQAPEALEAPEEVAGEEVKPAAES